MSVAKLKAGPERRADSGHLQAKLAVPVTGAGIAAGAHELADRGNVIDPPAWFDEGQASAYISVPVETLRTWRKRAQGPRYHKFGRCVRYARADVDSWVAGCAVGAPTGKPA